MFTKWNGANYYQIAGGGGEPANICVHVNNTQAQAKMDVKECCTPRGLEAKQKVKELQNRFRKENRCCNQFE